MASTAEGFGEGGDDSPFDPRSSTSSEADLGCDRCGAELSWDPGQEALHCAYCGNLRPVEVRGETIVEYAMSEAGQAARGYGREVRAMRCGQCGARVALEESVTSTSCPFCGDPNVLPQAASRNAIRPESLIPLTLSHAEVEEAFRKWLGRLWFRPSGLTRLKSFESTGLYVPAWTFDCRVNSDWTAQSGYYYYVTETYTTREGGRTVRRQRQVRKTRWESSEGSRRDVFDDHVVQASHGISAELATKLGDFNTRELVPYQAEYLAGWRAEEYQLDLEGAWEIALGRILALQERRCSADVPGDTQRALRVKNRVRQIRWKHVLLPLWSLTYSFGGRHWSVLVNGQSGKIVGRAPYSKLKIFLAVLLVLALAGAIWAAVRFSGH